MPEAEGPEPEGRKLDGPPDEQPTQDTSGDPLFSRGNLRLVGERIKENKAAIYISAAFGALGVDLVLGAAKVLPQLLVHVPLKNADTFGEAMAKTVSAMPLTVVDSYTYALWGAAIGGAVGTVIALREPENGEEQSQTVDKDPNKSGCLDWVIRMADMGFTTGIFGAITGVGSAFQLNLSLKDSALVVLVDFALAGVAGAVGSILAAPYYKEMDKAISWGLGISTIAPAVITAIPTIVTAFRTAGDELSKVGWLQMLCDGLVNTSPIFALLPAITAGIFLNEMRKRLPQSARPTPAASAASSAPPAAP